MKEQKIETKQESDFQTQKNIMKRLAFELDLKGSKNFSILERGEEISIIDTGISGKSIVNLVLSLAIDYEPFFLHALECLKNYEEDMEDAEHASVN